MRSSERYEAVHLHRGGRASGGRQQGRHGEGGVRGEDAGAGRSTAQQAQERRGGSPAVTPTPCSLSLPRKPRRPRSRVFDPRHWSPFRFTFALGHSGTGLLSFNFWRVVGGNNEHYNPQRATLKKQLDSTSQRTVPAFPHSRGNDLTVITLGPDARCRGASRLLPIFWPSRERQGSGWEGPSSWKLWLQRFKPSLSCLTFPKYCESYVQMFPEPYHANHVVGKRRLFFFFFHQTKKRHKEHFRRKILTSPCPCQGFPRPMDSDLLQNDGHLARFSLCLYGSLLANSHT